MAASMFDKKLLAPRYWLTWLGIGILWCLAHFPWSIQRRLGASIGWLVYRLAKPRVEDTRINLKLCFPEKTEAEREVMVRDVFRNAGFGVFETLNAWFRGVDYFRGKVEFEGIEHYHRTVAQGRGLVLIGAHYTTLDLLATLAAQHVRVDMVYRPQKNPIFEYLMRRGREESQGRMIANTDTRGMLRAFKENRNVWYPLDQDYGRQHAVFVPFFGVPAATLTTASRFSRINQAPVIFVGVQRPSDQQFYRVIFTPSLENFPSGDDTADAARINLELEKLIRLAPTQYMWFHRRFKTQTNGLPEPYAMKKKWKKRLQSSRSSPL
jgi:KDO2-lipid IV(A) lauroyltransferase